MASRVLARLVLGGLAVSCSACVTSQSIRSLSAPSPMWLLSVEPAGDQVVWRGTYSTPPAGVDDWSGIFELDVTRAGRVDVDPAATCVASPYAHGSLFPVSARIPLSVGTRQKGYRPVEASPEPDRSAPPQCRQVLSVLTAGEGRKEYASALLIRSLDGSEPRQVPLPPERPTREPERWTWLTISPLLDAVLVALTGPVLIGAFVYDTYEHATR